MLETYLKHNIEAIEYLQSSCMDEIQELAKAIVRKIKSGNNIFFVGVGGCAALCDAILQDMNGYHRPRNRKVFLYDLSANTSLILRNINDLGADTIFSQQLESLGDVGDLIISISCSGESKSIVQVQKRANEMLLETSCISSCKESTLGRKSNTSIILPSRSNAIFENAAHIVLHGIAEIVDETLNNDNE